MAYRVNLQDNKKVHFVFIIIIIVIIISIIIIVVVVVVIMMINGESFSKPPLIRLSV